MCLPARLPRCLPACLPVIMYQGPVSSSTSCPTPPHDPAGLRPHPALLNEVRAGGADTPAEAGSVAVSGGGADTAAEGGGSIASSLSFQSLLQPGGDTGNSSCERHNLKDTRVSQTAGQAGSQKGSQVQVDPAGSLVLKPPLPQPPFNMGNRSGSVSRRLSSNGRRSSSSGGGGGGGGVVSVCGLVLLHPNLSGQQVPAFTRLLAMQGPACSWVWWWGLL